MEEYPAMYVLKDMVQECHDFVLKNELVLRNALLTDELPSYELDLKEGKYDNVFRLEYVNKHDRNLEKDLIILDVDLSFFIISDFSLGELNPFHIQEYDYNINIVSNNYYIESNDIIDFTEFEEVNITVEDSLQLSGLTVALPYEQSVLVDKFKDSRIKLTNIYGLTLKWYMIMPFIINNNKLVTLYPIKKVYLNLSEDLLETLLFVFRHDKCKTSTIIIESSDSSMSDIKGKLRRVISRLDKYDLNVEPLKLGIVGSNDAVINYLYNDKEFKSSLSRYFELLLVYSV